MSLSESICLGWYLLIRRLRWVSQNPSVQASLSASIHLGKSLQIHQFTRASSHQTNVLGTLSQRKLRAARIHRDLPIVQYCSIWLWYSIWLLYSSGKICRFDLLWFLVSVLTNVIGRIVKELTFSRRADRGWEVWFHEVGMDKVTHTVYWYI